MARIGLSVVTTVAFLSRPKRARLTMHGKANAVRHQNAFAWIVARRRSL
jgi:hypothetical protein